MSGRMDPGLVFDIGAHLGEDSAYYMARGYRVIAAECEPAHVALLKTRFAAEIASGQFTLLDRCIAPGGGQVTFYRNLDISVWGTMQRSWADRNIREGTRIEELGLPAMAPEELFDRYGIPYYLKIDVEGADMAVLEALEAQAGRPAYVSLESSHTSFDDLRREFETLRRLGYDRFKLSPQHLVHRMRVPADSVHGRPCDHSFEPHASGLFGEDLPGPWLTQTEAIAEYKAVFVLYDLYDALQKGVLQGSVRDFRNAYGHDAGGWYDTHARHSGH